MAYPTRMENGVRIVDPDAHETLGAPARVDYSFRALDGTSIEIGVTLRDKPANRMPEASFVTFTPAGAGEWEGLKTGLWNRIDTVAPSGGAQLQAVFAARRGRVELRPLDTPLVAPLDAAFMRFHHQPPGFAAGLRFNLHNNKWGHELSGLVGRRTVPRALRADAALAAIDIDADGLATHWSPSPLEGEGARRADEGLLQASRMWRGPLIRRYAPPSPSRGEGDRWDTDTSLCVPGQLVGFACRVSSGRMFRVKNVSGWAISGRGRAHGGAGLELGDQQQRIFGLAVDAMLAIGGEPAQGKPGEHRFVAAVLEIDAVGLVPHQALFGFGQGR